jgi:plasmid replication initiation protein
MPDYGYNKNNTILPKVHMRQMLLPYEIKKSNALARARWNIESVWEPRLVALLASKVRADDTDFQIYEIPVSDIFKGRVETNQGKTDYQEIGRVTDNLMGRVLTIRDEVGRGWTKFNVFSRCRYRPEDKILEMRFDPDMKPYYLQLQEQFVRYNLIEFLMLPSVYSQRIFEILKSWSGLPEVTIPLDELHEMLNTPPSSRADFKEFRTRVLEQAHKDIHRNQSRSLTYSWQAVKQGRKVVAIRFVFSSGLIAQAEAKAEKNTKGHSKAERAAFVEAVRCWAAKNKNCTTPNNRKAICRACDKHQIRQ